MVKEDFPILRDLVYLDNAATTQKPLSVINVIEEFYERHNANIHRGVYPLARRATEMYEEARRTVADFIGGKYEEIIFVRNATEGLNLASWILSSTLPSGGNIVVTMSEHHSNLLPWWRLAKQKGARLKIVDIREDGTIDDEALLSAIDEETRVVAVQAASNVTGYIVNLQRIIKKVREVGAYLVVDGAQSVPHMPTKVEGFDFLAFSGHKMLGPMGIGVLWARKDILEEAEPWMLGGDMIKSVRVEEGELVVEWNDIPWKFEAGTPNVTGAVGLKAAIEYLENYGMEKILKHERKLSLHLYEWLVDRGFRVIGSEKRGGVVAFWKEGTDPHLMALRLGAKRICVRSGFHCAEPLHRRLGFHRGSVRASFYLYNDEEDVEKLVEALEVMG